MKIQNPLFYADMPDPDIIRVGTDFYMVSTTMFFMPAAPVLKSKDLKHWEIVSYICDRIADNAIYRLENGKNAYGKGQWATSLMHYQGRFYACFVCHDMKKTYLFSTDDIERSNWDRTEIDYVCHDMSFLVLDNRVYLVYGNGEIRIVEWKQDFSGFVEGTDRLLLHTPKEGLKLRCEGCRACVKDGWIYLFFIDWPESIAGRRGMRREVCYRLKDLSGAYERKTILYDDMHRPGCGIAQGPIFDDVYGNWYAIMFQDCGAVGRVPFLMPVKWKDGWPVLGTDGKVPESLEVPFEESKETEEIIQSDSFHCAENRLKKVWQWNHAPNQEAWSFTERPGFLRLKNMKMAGNLLEAGNTLTQRTSTPYSEFLVELDCRGMKEGDYAGLCVLLEKYGQIGVRKKNGRCSIVMKCADGDRACLEIPPEVEIIWLKIVFYFDSWGSGKETADFFYSPDGETYCRLGDELTLIYTLALFVGARIGIFSYNEEGAEGGWADFRNFVYRKKDEQQEKSRK